MFRSIGAFGLSAIATLAAYLALLGWDQEMELGPDGLHGPYSAWQVVVVALILAVIAGLSGYFGHTAAGPVATTIAFTVAWSIDAATDHEEPSLWPLGAIEIAFGCAFILPLVAILGSRVRDHQNQRT